MEFVDYSPIFFHLVHVCTVVWCILSTFTCFLQLRLVPNTSVVVCPSGPVARSQTCQIHFKFNLRNLIFVSGVCTLYLKSWGCRCMGGRLTGWRGWGVCIRVWGRGIAWGRGSGGLRICRGRGPRRCLMRSRSQRIAMIVQRRS